MLEDIRNHGVDKIACLGDALQGGSQPAETLGRLREIGCPVVMGNADSWLVSGKESQKGERTSEKQEKVRQWSLAKLSKDDLDYIQQKFQPTIEISLAEGKRKLLCFHGSPSSYDDIILPSTSDEEVKSFLSGHDTTFLAGGHTHTQQLRRVGNASWYINPGSVALPYNWERSNMETEQIVIDPWADYAIISSEETGIFGVTFCHVPYDLDQFSENFRKSGIPFAEESLIKNRRD